MAIKRDRPHIRVWRSCTAQEYTPHRSGGPGKKIGPPGIGRAAHAAALEAALHNAERDAAARRASSGITVESAQLGIYLEFESMPGWELAISSLEKTQPKDPMKRIEVVAVTEASATSGAGFSGQRAIVFVPDGQIGYFLSRIEQYALTSPKKFRERRYEDMFDRIATLRLATLKALWTDDASTYPADATQSIWWEIWLRRTDGRELERLYEFAQHTNVRVHERRLQFDDRIVTMLYGSAQQLTASLDVLNDLAEVRQAKETAGFFVDQSAKEQAEWVANLLTRTTPAWEANSSVCILDTGVNRGHPLLEASLSESDCHAVTPEWGTHDDHPDGHGTAMAGLALYGDLVPVLSGDYPVHLRHVLESVKILPPRGDNEPELYGAITAEAVSRAEIQASTRRRCFSLAVTTQDTRDRGQPTSWSSAIDALAAGRSFDASSKGLVYLDADDEHPSRLFVISAGNVDAHLLEPAHLDRSDTEPIHDPAQAWNAVTVGAYTDKAFVEDDSWAGWHPVAQPGDLSPWSTTSVAFAEEWPHKPDVVMEGGNVVRNSSGEIDYPCPDMCVLTTHNQPAKKPLALSWATSPATAQVARIAATIAAEYPDLWPETVRGLVIHSAEWTSAMRARLQREKGKTVRARLVRRYGFGVPNLERALRSASNQVTLLIQDSIHPFRGGKMREMHLHTLPWPRDILEQLGTTTIRLRVTLSYFVEPNPGRRGWQKRHRYQSHGLRFDVKRPIESVDDLKKRLNKQALDEEEKKPSSDSDASNWFLGKQARDRGSIHSDILQGTAAEIAARGVVAVYPVTGWWKEQANRDRSERGARYALIMSIETDVLQADIWAAIANQVGLSIETAIT